MQNNLNNPNISQFFGDTTYYCVPPHNKGIKLFILLGFDNSLKKNILLLLALIKNENFETIYEIIKYLKKILILIQN